MPICLTAEEGRLCGRESGPRVQDARLVSCPDCLRLREEAEADPEFPIQD